MLGFSGSFIGIWNTWKSELGCYSVISISSGCELDLGGNWKDVAGIWLKVEWNLTKATMVVGRSWE